MKKALLLLIPAAVVFAGCGPTAALGSIAAMAGTQIYNQGTGAYTTLASGMTHYAFDLVEVTNDGGIATGKVESGPLGEENAHRLYRQHGEHLFQVRR